MNDTITEFSERAGVSDATIVRFCKHLGYKGYQDFKAKNCIITPHISWATKEARERILQTTAENIMAFMKGAPVNVVNS